MSKAGRRAAVAVALACGLAGGTAHAQSAGFAVDRFEPAAAGGDWFTLDSLDLRGELVAGASLSGDLALEPVVIYDRAGRAVAPLVSRQAMLHADVAVVLWSRLRFDLELPVAVWQQGTGGQASGQTFVPPTSELLGDIRVGADVRLYGQAGDLLTVAIGGRLFIPTGHISAFTSDDGPRFWPHVAAAGEKDRLVWAASLGYHVRPTSKCTCALTPGSELTAAVAVGYRIAPRVLLGPELYASSGLGSGRFATAVGTPVELLLGAHYAFVPGWQVGAGAAPGLTDGAGSPSWRFVAMLQFWPSAAAMSADEVSAPPPLRSPAAEPRSLP